MDELLFCTGYTYRFPFLEGGNNTLGAGPDAPVVSVRDNTVYPLYRHMLPPAAPSIAFIGLPAKVIPFPQFEVQSRYMSQVWAGNVTLPPAAAMLREIEEVVAPHASVYETPLLLYETPLLLYETPLLLYRRRCCGRSRGRSMHETPVLSCETLLLLYETPL